MQSKYSTKLSTSIELTRIIDGHVDIEGITFEQSFNNIRVTLHEGCTDWRQTKRVRILEQIGRVGSDQQSMTIMPAVRQCVVMGIVAENIFYRGVRPIFKKILDNVRLATDNLGQKRKLIR